VILTLSKVPGVLSAGFAVALLIAPCAAWAQSEQPPAATAGQTTTPTAPASPPPKPAAPAPKPAPRQTTSDSSAEKTSQRSFWFGGIGIYSPFKLISAGTNVVPSSTTTLTTTYSAQSGNRPIAEGFTFHVHLFKKFSLSADAIHRSVGYNASTGIAGGTITAPTTTTVITNYTYEITNATFWDFPILVEYQTRHRWYYEGGAAYRRVADIMSWRFFRNSVAVTTTSTASVATTNNDTCCNETPASAAHNGIVGIVAGIGMHVREPLGLKVTPEIRFTRWLENTFSSGAVHSSYNQAEVLIGIAF
jgi:hypothetical protein